MNELAYYSYKQVKIKMFTSVIFVAVQSIVPCFLLYCPLRRFSQSYHGALQPYIYFIDVGKQAALFLFFWHMSMTEIFCSVTFLSARVLWVWTYPNDWQDSSSSCKLGMVPELNSRVCPSEFTSVLPVLLVVFISTVLVCKLGKIYVQYIYIFSVCFLCRHFM